MRAGERLCGPALRIDQLGTALTKRAPPTIGDHRGSHRLCSYVDAVRAVVG